MRVSYHMCICMLDSIQNQAFKTPFGTITEADSLMWELLRKTDIEKIFIIRLYVVSKLHTSV